MPVLALKREGSREVVHEIAHTLSFYPRGRNWAYFCSTGSSFWDTGCSLKFPYLAMKSGIWRKVPKLHTRYVVSFYPRGSKFSLFSLCGPPFSRYGPFFKFPYLGMKPGIWRQVPKLYIHSLSITWLEIRLILALRAAVFGIRTDLQNSIFGHEIWNSKKSPKFAYVLSFYTKGSKSRLFSLYGQLFSRYGPFFKISICGHDI